MSIPVPSTRKRAVNLTLNEALVEQARAYTDNLSATLENLMLEYVQRRQRADLERRKDAQACAAQWNDCHDKVGAFADEHTTL